LNILGQAPAVKSASGLDRKQIRTFKIVPNWLLLESGQMEPECSGQL